MGIAGRVAEVPDSEDEPFTSSSEALPDGIGQLDGTAEERPQDASSRGGGFPNLLEDTDVNKAAEHTTDTCNDEQQAASDGVQAIDADTVTQANPESDMLQRCANELEISHPIVSSLTDICDSSNQHASVSTNPSPVHLLNKQETASETASSHNKEEQIIPAGQSVLRSTVETPYAASSPTCANHDSTATEDELLKHDVKLVPSSGEDAIHPAYYGLAARVSTIEGGFPHIQPTEQEPTGLVSVERSPSSQYGHSKESHLGSYAGKTGPHDNNGDSSDPKERDCSCPPSLSTADSSSTSNAHAPRRSKTTDEAMLSEQTQYEEQEGTGSVKLPRSTNENSTQPSVSLTNDSDNIQHKTTMEHINQDSSTKSVQLPSVLKQQLRVESVGEHGPAHSELIVGADFAPSLGSSNEPDKGHDIEAMNNEKLNVPALEASSTILQKPDEAQGTTAIKSENQNNQEHIGSKEETGSYPVVEVAATEPTSNAVLQTSSSAASIAEEPQLVSSKTPQAITLAELRAKKAALIASLARLPAIQELLADTRSPDVSSQVYDTDPTESEVMAAAHRINKKHIQLLHEYNEIKDVGQGLMGLIADQRGVRIVEVQDDFGIDAKD